MALKMLQNVGLNICKNNLKEKLLYTVTIDGLYNIYVLYLSNSTEHFPCGLMSMLPHKMRCATASYQLMRSIVFLLQ